jgi:hypothetical protein
MDIRLFACKKQVAMKYDKNRYLAMFTESLQK